MININEIICGDGKQLIKDIPDNSIDLIILDPPYMTTKESWDQEEVVDTELAKQLFRVAKDNCSLYVWCGIGEKSQSLIRWFPIFSDVWHFKDLVTWKKQRGIGMRKGWLYTREEIMWFVKDNKEFVWNKDYQYSDEERPWSITRNGKMVNKSKFKRITNVWTDIMEVGFGSSPQSFSEARSKLAYTPKPVEAYERIINLHTKEGELVLDIMAGSFTTAIACQNTNRNWICIDEVQEFCNIGQARLDELR